MEGASSWACAPTGGVAPTWACAPIVTAAIGAGGSGRMALIGVGAWR